MDCGACLFSRLLKMSDVLDKYEDILPTVNPAFIRLAKIGLLMVSHATGFKHTSMLTRRLVTFYSYLR